MGFLSVIPEIMGRSIWVHIPQDDPNSNSEALGFRSVWTTIWFSSSLKLKMDHLLLFRQIDGEIWEIMVREREVSGVSTEGSNIQTFIDRKTDTVSSTK